MNCCDNPSVIEIACRNWRSEVVCSGITPPHRHGVCGNCQTDYVRLLPPPPPPKSLLRQMLDGDIPVKITWR